MCRNGWTKKGKNAISRSDHRQICQQGGNMKSKQHRDWKGNQRKEESSLLTQALWMGLVSTQREKDRGCTSNPRLAVDWHA